MFDGRVIRTEEDTGAVLLVDDRYGEDPYPSLYPPHWSAIAQVEDESLQSLEAFWNTVEEALEDAKENAKRNGIENIRFIAGDVLKVLDDVEKKPDMIIIAPPRIGIHPRAIPKMARHEVPHITYISCNPVTFVRDLEIFREWGYDVEKIEAVDMFPRTPHVECVVLMSRAKNQV